MRDKRRQGSPANRGRAFTLVELLVSTTVVSLLVLLLAKMTDETSAVWRRTTGRVEQFREARAGFEAMTTRLAQATLNTYWDYEFEKGDIKKLKAPIKYSRRSELRFISGPAEQVLGSGGRPTHCVFFQAPLGITEEPKYKGFENLLSSWGYFVEFGDDQASRPLFLRNEVPLRHRFRLKELWQPAEANTIYKFTSGPGKRADASRDWFINAVAPASPNVHVLAENVIALVITPRLAPGDEKDLKSPTDPYSSPLAPDYLYDSAPSDKPYGKEVNPIHQLPPLLQVTMVAIDEASALRLNLTEASSDLFRLKDKFRDTSKYGKDLLVGGASESLEDTLIKSRINYRVFSTNVIIRGAKWSREQSN